MKLIQALKLKKDISTLVQDGSDVNAEDYEGHTPLMIASGSFYLIPANPENIKLLIENGANVNMAAKKGNNITALIAASGWNNPPNLQAIRLLIENGANVNAVNIYGNTALMYSLAIEKYGIKTIEAFKLLLENGADMHIVNNLGCTVYTYLRNSPNAQKFQSAINRHYRKKNLTYIAAIENSVTTTTTGKFFKSSANARRDWKMHINSFLSLNKTPN